MATKVKGLLKGLRYISQIFDTKEHEMQIGYPTDVKHVAHIGLDGPSVNPPSWMNEFRSAPLSALGAEAMADQPPTRFPSHDFSSRGTEDSPIPELRDPPVPKPRRHASTGSAESAAAAADATPTRPHGAPRRSRRNKCITDGGEGSNSGVGTPVDSPARELPLIPKVARKKKPKAGGAAAAAEGGSSRSAKSRARATSSDGGGLAKEDPTVDLPEVHSPGREDEGM